MRVSKIIGVVGEEDTLFVYLFMTKFILILNKFRIIYHDCEQNTNR